VVLKKIIIEFESIAFGECSRYWMAREALKKNIYLRLSSGNSEYRSKSEKISAVSSKIAVKSMLLVCQHFI